ncbi:recombination mediator RecR [Tsukamurella soli]|uniref:Recombination protein RecR n=1 Tax=Tsukamurella soli TaxID=644556 RepID=A0ABP8J7L4_9ACTN
MYEGPVQELIDELAKLPGVGPRGAQRIAFHLLGVQPGDIDRLTRALDRVRNDVRYCEVCGNVSAEIRCRICSDARRDRSTICVVEEAKDVQAVERTREFDGLYHVLGGALNPIKSIGPDKLRIRELLVRLGTATDGVDVSEVIIATDPNTEGEATAAFLVRMLRDFPGLTVTRPASGLPMGAELEFADELTLGRAMTGRRALSEPPRVVAEVRRPLDETLVPAVGDAPTPRPAAPHFDDLPAEPDDMPEDMLPPDPGYSSARMRADV